MSQVPPFRQRPNLHLALTPLTGSPRHLNQNTPTTTPLSSYFATPSGTPLATTAYSPFRSAGIQPPTPNGGPMAFKPRLSQKSCYGNYKWFRIKRMFSSKPIWLLFMTAALMLWWFNGGSEEIDMVKLGASGFGREFLQERRMQDFQFYPASNPKIHYVGRWTSTPNRLRKDGAFPGAYFDVVVRNTTTLFLALHNAPNPVSISSANFVLESPTSVPSSGRLSIRPLSANEKPAHPISLLARVDDEEYVLLPNSSSLVSVCPNNLDRGRDHHIRTVAPMTDDFGRGVVELEGIWLSKGGTLAKVAGSSLSDEYADEDLLSADNNIVGERHRTGLNGIENDRSSKGDRKITTEEDDESLSTNQERKKILEVITDSPGSFVGKARGRRTGGADGLLAGVMGWEYLLGEMFGADHVGIGVDGMCLTQDCVGGTGYPAGIGDVFFRSGPYGSVYFEHSWMFSAYIPDVLVLNLGGSDDASFSERASDYKKNSWDLAETFETTYVSLVKGIRRLAYPKHPTIVQSERLGSPGVVSSTAPASIPIFVMRPLRGQLEQATQNAVTKLRADGDKSVFWLDTSGWLDPGVDSDDVGDFFLDDTVTPLRWRLTEQGNQRVAIFLHMHVCRYLAGDEEKCAFLPHEVYQGKVYDEEEASFDRFLENEKERKLQKLFWETEKQGTSEELVI